MSTGNVVTTRVIAKDETASVFANLDRRMRNSALSANLMASAMTSAFSSVMQGATALIKGFSSAMSTAAQIQSSTLSTTGDLMKMTGMSFAETTDFIQDFRAEMAKTAATLPGATQDYADLGATIMDNLVPAFQEVGGGFDTSGFRESLNEISKFATLRAAVNGIESPLAGLGVSKFLGGTDVGELQRLKFFESNPAVLASIEQEAKKLGKEVKDLTAKERVEVLRAALKVPDEVVEGMRNSTEGILAGFKSALFDSETGLFGMLRDLDLEIEGVQSVEQSFNFFLRQIRNVSEALGGLLQASGLNVPDVMNGIRNGFNWLTNKLTILNKHLENLRDAGANFGDNLGENLRNFFGNFIQSMASAFNSVIANLRESLSAVDFSQAGAKFAELINLGFSWLRSNMANIDYAALGKLLGEIIAGAFKFLQSFIEKLDYGQIAKFFFDNMKNSITLIFEAIRNIIPSLISFLGSAAGMAIPDSTSPPEKTNNSPGRSPQVKASFLGNIPQGFLSAIQSELAGKPSGSNLTIANTSELIMNTSQQAGLASLIGSLVTGGNPSITIGDIHISSQSSNPTQVANEVIRQIENSINQARMNIVRV